MILDELRSKYANSKWDEVIQLALNLSENLQCREKANMLEWAAWAAASKADEPLRKEIHKKAAIIWEQLAINSQTDSEKAMYYSKASWDYNYHELKDGSLFDLTVDQEAKNKVQKIGCSLLEEGLQAKS